jgi:PAS domain-containing protein
MPERTTPRRWIAVNARFQFRHNPQMPQRDIGLILMRQLADGLAAPMLLADERGDLLFFNESAERLLGQRFDDVGELVLEERRRIFSFRDPDGNFLPDDQAPLVVALREHRPVHRRVTMRGLDGRDHEVEVTAFPLLGGGGHLIGGVAMFWERRKQA